MKKIIKADVHTEDIQLLLNEVTNIPKNGIIHIGAHLGEEVAEYRKSNFKKILLIEGNPIICDQLEAKFSDQKDINIENTLISDKEGLVDFYIHTSGKGNVEPASLLPMKEFNQIVKTLHTPKIEQLPSLSLKSCLENGNYTDYNFLNIDVQGAEMLVLKGSEDILNTFDVIIIEVAVVELYKNAPTEKDITDFLLKHGFEQKMVIYHTLYNENGSFPAWGEALFVKNEI